MTDKPLECRPAMREQAEQNMKAAHPAHVQLSVLVTKAMDAWKGAMRAGLEAGRSKDVQDRAVEVTKNAELVCALAEMIAKAQKFPEPSDNDNPSRRKSARPKTATSGTSATPLLPPAHSSDFAQEPAL